MWKSSSTRSFKRLSHASGGPPSISRELFEAQPAIPHSGSPEPSNLEPVPPPHSHDDDATLCNLLAGGDEQAFTTLYRRRSPAVYRYALSLGHSPPLADEVVQETFLALIRTPGSYDPNRGELTPWLLGVARKAFAKRRALDSRDLPWEPESQDPPATDPDAFEAMSRQERVTALRAAVDSLPVEYREVVALCDLEEISYADAATVLGAPVGTVRSRLHRARALLARKLNGLRSSVATEETP